MGIILQVNNITKKYGGLIAVNDLSFHMEEGEIVGLIGPNGAGKTTVFGCISGFSPPEAGSIKFFDHDITRLSPYRIAQIGIARTFQIVKPLRHMSVLDNISVGAMALNSNVNLAKKKALKLAQFGGLINKADMPAELLTLSDKKRLEILRCLAMNPKLLLLDETMAGLNPIERQEALYFIKSIKASMNVTILMIEHIMDIVMPISNRVVVLEYGTKIAEGSPNEISKDQTVIKAYLGESYHAAN